MSVPIVNSPRSPDLGPLRSLLLSIALGLAVACGMAIMAALFRPIFLVGALAGLLAFLPTLILKDVKRYWLTLFILSFLFDNVSKRMTSWLVDPFELLNTLGMPPGGNLSVHLHLSDLVLVAMVVPWLLRVATHRQPFHFPRIGFLALGYLVWALFVSLSRSASMTLSMFELFHQTVYFVTYLFIVNNMDRTGLVKAIIQGGLAVLVLESIVIVVVFYFQSYAFVFGGVYEIESQKKVRIEYRTETRSEDTFIVRSRGTFNHPGSAAAYLEFFLPLGLMLTIASSNARRRILLGSIFCLGVVGLILTFSRSAFLGSMLSFAVCLWMARRRNLIRPRTFHAMVAAAVLVVLVVSPLIWHFLARRPVAFEYRFVLIEGGIELALQTPILGVGLANSNAATMDFFRERGEGGAKGGLIIHNAYLIQAVETGLVGCALYFGFLVLAGRNALRASRSRDPEIRLLSLAILASFLGLALHMMADPFAGNALHSMLWIYAGVATALARVVMTRSQESLRAA